MDKVIEYAPAIALILVAIGLLGYAIALVLAAFFPRALGGRGAQLAAWFTTAPAQNLGLPCAVISAFAIIAVLLKAFPPASGASGQLELKAFVGPGPSTNQSVLSRHLTNANSRAWQHSLRSQSCRYQIGRGVLHLASELRPCQEQRTTSNNIREARTH